MVEGSGYVRESEEIEMARAGHAARRMEER